MSSTIAEMLVGRDGMDPTTPTAPLPYSILLSPPHHGGFLLQDALNAASHPEQLLSSPLISQSPIAIFFSGPPVARKASSDREKYARKSANSVLAGKENFYSTSEMFFFLCR